MGLRRRLLALAVGAAAAVPIVAATATPAHAACALDCYQFKSSTTNIYGIGSRDGDTSPTYTVLPGKYSHSLAGGVPFYVPAGCVAKTSSDGAYWAGWGWHWFPHHLGTVYLKPSSTSLKDC